MKEIVKREIVKREVVEATCDICGEDCMKELFFGSDSEGDSDDHEINKEFEGMELTAHWGWESKKDGERWEAVVCEKCVDKHLVPLIKFLKNSF